MAVYLTTLLAGITEFDAALDRQVTGISNDSRRIKPGDVFIAYPGYQLDGRDYIEQALAKGAVAVIVEEWANDGHVGLVNDKREKTNDIPYITINNLRRHVSQIAARFYGEPANNLQLIGITGTNGKSTCSYLICNVLHSSDSPCALLGTFGYGLPDNLQKGDCTTPDPIELQKMLAHFVKQGVRRVVMEVSSHALDQDRVASLQFECALFTNLSRDHLDYHGDMKKYAAAKRRLFTEFNLSHAVINNDDPYSTELLEAIPKQTKVITYSASNSKANVYASHSEFNQHGIQTIVHHPHGESELHSPLLGQFNLSNLLASSAVLSCLNRDINDSVIKLGKVSAIPGRLAPIESPNKPLLVIDYSHTPDSLAKALQVLRELVQGQLYCVFGCGGERDVGKRPLMAKAAEQYADHIIVTDDNPRGEASSTIINDILTGFQNPAAVTVQADRKQAIAHAIKLAKAKDTILIAGKGHETVQLVGKQALPFDDEQVARQLLNDLSFGSLD